MTSSNPIPGRFVLIRTLTPGLDLNYGNLLQAWALRRILLRIGQEAVFDASSISLQANPWVARMKNLIIRMSVWASPQLSPERWWRKQTMTNMVARQRTFVDKYLPSVSLTTTQGVVDEAVAARATAFVIGSDQVWRPRYVYLPSMLLEALWNLADSTPRFSYAASFGLSDTSEWTPDLIDRTRPLAQRLDGVSVRESSGVEVAKKLWGVEAVQHVDPTLLITPGEYLELASDAPSITPRGGLVDYVLDQSPGALQTVEAVASALGAESASLLPRKASSYREFNRNATRFQRPSVEAWLATIANAGFVVTDSFHGTIFSILNNVPFLTLVNHERGASRFHSLLRLFGLEDRAVDPGVQNDPDLVVRPIEWAELNARIERERQRSLEYIRSMLRLERA